jgi:hypothetical protein
MNQKFSDWIKTSLRESAWAPLCVMVFYLSGLAVHLYDLYPVLDIPSHFMGGMAITYFYRSAIRNSRQLLGETPHLIQALLAFALTGTTTILWEFYEFITDFFLGTHKIRGLEDTLTDLFVGLMGALVFSLLYRRRN